MDDITGLSKPLVKLVEVVAEGVGALAKPYLTYKNADAEAYKIRQLAAAMVDARKLLGNADYENDQIKIIAPNQEAIPEIKLLSDRAALREEYQASREQYNLEQVTNYARETLENATDVSDEQVGSDWIARFFDTVKHIGDEDMQKLWGKILADEVKQPKSYSLRTLETLKNLSKEEAYLFIKIAKFTLSVGQNRLVLYNDNGSYLQENEDIQFTDWLYLQELGLIYANDLQFVLDRQIPVSGNPYSVVFIGDKVLIAEYLDDSAKIRFNIKKFTAIGTQLLQLVEIPSNPSYINEVAAATKAKRDTIKIFIANYVKAVDGQILVQHSAEWIEKSPEQ